jgi:hypothetical protein
MQQEQEELLALKLKSKAPQRMEAVATANFLGMKFSFNILKFYCQSTTSLALLRRCVFCAIPLLATYCITNILSQPVVSIAEDKGGREKDDIVLIHEAQEEELAMGLFDNLEDDPDLLAI